MYFTNLRFCAKSYSWLAHWLSRDHNSRSEIKISFLKRLAGSLLLKQSDIKYKLSIFWAVFRGRSRSVETLWCVTSRRSEASKRQRLKSMSCSGLRLNKRLVTYTLYRCSLHASLYHQIGVTLQWYNITCTRAWFSSIWFELKIDRRIICGSHRYP